VTLLSGFIRDSARVAAARLEFNNEAGPFNDIRGKPETKHTHLRISFFATKIDVKAEGIESFWFENSVGRTIQH
jgi:hypothetical protein